MILNADWVMRLSDPRRARVADGGTALSGPGRAVWTEAGQNLGGGALFLRPYSLYYLYQSSIDGARLPALSGYYSAQLLYWATRIHNYSPGILDTLHNYPTGIFVHGWEMRRAMWQGSRDGNPDSPHPLQYYAMEALW